MRGVHAWPNYITTAVVFSSTHGWRRTGNSHIDTGNSHSHIHPDKSQRNRHSSHNTGRRTDLTTGETDGVAHRNYAVVDRKKSIGGTTCFTGYHRHVAPPSTTRCARFKSGRISNQRTSAAPIWIAKLTPRVDLLTKIPNEPAWRAVSSLCISVQQGHAAHDSELCGRLLRARREPPQGFRSWRREIERVGLRC